MFEKINFFIAFIVIFSGTFIIGNLSHFLGENKNWKSSSTRKFNHFGISLISIILFSFVPIENTTATAIFASVGVLIIYTISAKSNNRYVSSIIDSNVRERDMPNGKFFVFLPLITGQLALYVSLLTLNPILVKIAFCSMGFGDGLAEPIGTRYGKHQYVIKDYLWNKENTKSLQGSSAVFFVSLISCFIFLHLYFHISLIKLLLISVFYSIFVTFIEATSPRGLDNFLIILLGSIFLSLIDYYQLL